MVVIYMGIIYKVFFYCYFLTVNLHHKSILYTLPGVPKTGFQKITVK